MTEPDGLHGDASQIQELLTAKVVAAILGGLTGMRYHRKVDKAGLGI